MKIFEDFLKTCTPYYCHLVDSVIIYGGEIGDNDHDDDDAGGVMLAILVSQKCACS